MKSCCGFETSYARFDCKFVLWPSYSKVFSVVRRLTVIVFKVVFFFFVRIRNPITLKQETILLAQLTNSSESIYDVINETKKQKTKNKKVEFYKLFHAISDRTFFQLIEAFSPQRLLSLHPALIFT